MTYSMVHGTELLPLSVLTMCHQRPTTLLVTTLPAETFDTFLSNGDLQCFDAVGWAAGRASGL